MILSRRSFFSLLVLAAAAAALSIGDLLYFLNLHIVLAMIAIFPSSGFIYHLPC